MDSDSDSDSDYNGGDGGRTSTSIQRCLRTIGIDDAAKRLGGCTNITEEFTAIKKAYFRKILVCHPDKGGDAAVFRDVNSSFELIRKLYEDRAVNSFAAAAESSAQDRYDYDYGSKGSGNSSSSSTGGGAGSASSPWRSWQYYYDAAEEEVPHYKVELARSGRSKCNGTKTARQQQCPSEDGLIGKGEIRIGSLDPQAGAYARWIHLECWRVPSRIWQGLPQDDAERSLAACVAALSGMNEVNLTGFKDLSPHDQQRLGAHAMHRSNWARLTAKKPQSQVGRASSSSGGYAGGAGYASGAAGYGGGASYAGSTGYGSGASYEGGGACSMMVPSGGAALSLDRHQGSHALVAPKAAARNGFYVVPRPGVHGARADFLKGKTVVITGVFPEIGGGMGLNLGKDRLRKMCEDFGARVTSSVSGKTDILIVGKEPGASKVGKARDSAKCQLISLADLTLSIQGKQQLETAADATEQIESFSAGYQSGRMLAMGGEARRLLKPAAPAAKPKPKPKPKPRARKSAAFEKSATGSKKRKAAAGKPASAAKKAPARRGRARKKTEDADTAVAAAPAH